MNILRTTLFALACTAALASAQTPAPSPTLARIKSANALKCGVDFEEAEYSTKDAHGNHSAFDLDLCKAIAVAVLGPNAKFTAVPYRAEDDALKGLKSGEVDVLATGSPNYMNTAALGIGFTRPVFYDYQGFLVNKTLGIHSAKDLAGKKVCFIDGTELQNQLDGYMRREAIKYIPFPFQEEGEMEAALITRNCAAVTADVSQLAYERIAFKGAARNFEILPDVVARDPLAIAFHDDANDPRWGTLLSWIFAALVQAEESGVTQSNVAAMSKSDDPVIQRLLGTQRGYGQYLGLDDAWAVHLISAVGNYGELFDRTLGPASIMRLDRGANNLWNRGGLIDAPPIR
jgi:general L-amino acid transport system substrate-binding protein